jgi:hypothetical protein
VRLEGLGKLKKKKDLIEPATFQLVAQRLNQLRYRVSPTMNTVRNKSAINQQKLHEQQSAFWD